MFGLERHLPQQHRDAPSDPAPPAVQFQRWHLDPAVPGLLPSLAPGAFINHTHARWDSLDTAHTSIQIVTDSQILAQRACGRATTSGPATAATASAVHAWARWLRDGARPRFARGVLGECSCKGDPHAVENCERCCCTGSRDVLCAAAVACSGRDSQRWRARKRVQGKQRAEQAGSASSSLPEYGSPRDVYKAKTASRSLDGTSKETWGSAWTNGPQQTARGGAAPKTSPPHAVAATYCGKS